MGSDCSVQNSVQMAGNHQASYFKQCLDQLFRRRDLQISAKLTIFPLFPCEIHIWWKALALGIPCIPLFFCYFRWPEIWLPLQWNASGKRFGIFTSIFRLLESRITRPLEQDLELCEWVWLSFESPVYCHRKPTGFLWAVFWGEKRKGELQCFHIIL